MSDWIKIELGLIYQVYLFQKGKILPISLMMRAFFTFRISLLQMWIAPLMKIICNRVYNDFNILPLWVCPKFMMLDEQCYYLKTLLVLNFVSMHCLTYLHYRSHSCDLLFIFLKKYFYVLLKCDITIQCSMIHCY